MKPSNHQVSLEKVLIPAGYKNLIDKGRKRPLLIGVFLF
jgi:hypothetical protein